MKRLSPAISVNKDNYTIILEEETSEDYTIPKSQPKISPIHKLKCQQTTEYQLLEISALYSDTDLLTRINSQWTGKHRRDILF